jgi:hypothetical protein
MNLHPTNIYISNGTLCATGVFVNTYLEYRETTLESCLQCISRPKLYGRDEMQVVYVKIHALCAKVWRPNDIHCLNHTYPGEVRQFVACNHQAPQIDRASTLVKQTVGIDQPIKKNGNARNLYIYVANRSTNMKTMAFS